MSPLGSAVLLAAGLLSAGPVLAACGRSTPPEEHPSPKQAQKPTPEPTPPQEPSKSPQPTAAPEPEAKPEPPAPKKRYVVAALGDSITDDTHGGGKFLNVLRERCPKSAFLNFGKGGDMTNQMRRRFERDIKPQIKEQGINTILVYGGVNDLYSDLTANRKNDKIEEDLTKIYRGARDAGLEVIAITVSPWGGFTRYWNERRGTNTKLLNSWIMGQVATGLVDKAVDSFAPLSCGDPDKLCPEYENRFHDGLHPGADGHAILGQKIADEALSDCL